MLFLSAAKETMGTSGDDEEEKSSLSHGSSRNADPFFRFFSFFLPAPPFEEILFSRRRIFGSMTVRERIEEPEVLSRVAVV